MNSPLLCRLSNYRFLALSFFMLLICIIPGSGAFAQEPIEVDPVRSISEPEFPQYPHEHISQFFSDITVRKNGTIEVVETIEYDFGYQTRRGIFRYIPIRFPYEGSKPKNAVNGSKYKRVTPIEFDTIYVDGLKATTEVTRDEDNKVLRIGDENIFLTGKHTYKISYTLKNFINKFENHDELYLNVTGLGWDVPVNKAVANVVVEGVDDVAALDATCYSGKLYSSLPCDSITKSDGSVVFTQESLYPFEGLSVVVGVKKGILDPAPIKLKEQWTFASAFRITPTTVGGFIAVILIGLVIVGLLVYRIGRDRRYVGSAIDAAMGNITGQEQLKEFAWGQTSPVEFVPPDKIRPGQVGALIDEVVDDVDITATIVDLAVRGYLTIDETTTTQKNFLGVPRPKFDYVLTKKKEYNHVDELYTYEKDILKAFFSRKESFTLSRMTDIQGEELYKVKGTLYKDLVENKWYRKRPDQTRSKWSVIGFVSVVISVLILILGAITTHFGFTLLGLPIMALIFSFLHKKMPARTGKGAAMAGRVVGFKRLFDVGEGERQAFAEKANLFLEYLPYAIVFGCAVKWAKVFEDLGFSEQDLGMNSFYSGTTPFSPVGFAYALNSFSQTSIGTISTSYASSTSSFSSGGSGFSGGGGGFSGGGGGGGGGGSW